MREFCVCFLAGETYKQEVINIEEKDFKYKAINDKLRDKYGSNIKLFQFWEIDKGA